MNKIYCIILSWNYRNQQDQQNQNFDIAPVRYRSKSAAALCAKETVEAELNLFSRVNEVDAGACKVMKHRTRDVWTLSVADGSKPYTFRAEVVECIL